MQSLVLLATLVVATACSSAPRPPAQSQAPSTTTLSGLKAATEGYEKLLSMKTIEGQALSRGEGPTAVVVFASWCGHCRRELGYLGDLRQQYPSLRIIGLNAYEEFQDFSDSQRLASYIAQSAPWLTEIVHAEQSTLEQFGGVPRIPTLFLYDASGKASHQFRADQGQVPSREELARALAEVFAITSPAQ